MANTLNPVPRIDGNVLARRNELNVLKAVRLFGHLRRSEIGRIVWPHTSARSRRAMVQRTMKRVLAEQWLLERKNLFGTPSFVLSAKGAARLRAEGFDEVSDGYDLAGVRGPQFWHRTVGTHYLIERLKRGHDVFGEHAIYRGWTPVARQVFAKRFDKIPDGIVVVPGPERGFKPSVRLVDWIEVESAYKPKEDLIKLLSLAWQTNDWLAQGDTEFLLDQLVIVYDRTQPHESAILTALDAVRALMRDKFPERDDEEYLNSIILVSADIGYPVTWNGYTERSALDLIKAGPGLAAPAPDPMPRARPRNDHNFAVDFAQSGNS